MESQDFSPARRHEIFVAMMCDGQPDGLYAEGCNSEFHACVGGRAIEMRCPGSQVFDAERKQCSSKVLLRHSKGPSDM